MIAKSDFETENPRGVIYLREKAEACHACKKQPGHAYDPGVRLIGCGRKECPCIADDVKLIDGFRAWNRKQKELAKSAPR